MHAIELILLVKSTCCQRSNLKDYHLERMFAQVQLADEKGRPGAYPRQRPHGGVQVQVSSHLRRDHGRGCRQVTRADRLIPVFDLV